MNIPLLDHLIVGEAAGGHRDFIFTRDAWILQQIPSLQPLPEWFAARRSMERVCA